jgi:hypothetical protein
MPAVALRLQEFQHDYTEGLYAPTEEEKSQDSEPDTPPQSDGD